jgi:hypothetical protein
MGTDDEEEAVQQIAWRWRFARRWQAEQTRAPLDPAATASPGDGGMEEALQYLAACGENWQHISRESSRLGTVESRLLGTLGSLGCLGSELLADESFSGASAFGMQTSLLQDTADSGGVLAAACAEDSKRVSMTGSSDGQAQQVQEQEQQAQQAQQRRRHKKLLQPRGEATVEVTGITKKAQEMLAAQKEFSKAAKERWAGSSLKEYVVVAARMSAAKPVPACSTHATKSCCVFPAAPGALVMGCQGPVLACLVAKVLCGRELC